MIKSILRYFLRDELNAIRLEAIKDQAEYAARLEKSLVLSFNTIKERIATVENLALITSDAVERLESVLNDELDLLAGAHEHLDDTVQGICDELNKDHDVLGTLFGEIMERLEDLEG